MPTLREMMATERAIGRAISAVARATDSDQLSRILGDGGKQGLYHALDTLHAVHSMLLDTEFERSHPSSGTLKVLNY